ncbi:MAG: VTT domain-containing protein [Caldilineaceae bacterium]
MNSLWQYLLIYLLVAVEGAGVTLAAAALAGTGMLTPLWVFLAAGTGNLTGDFCWYLLGYFGQFDRLLRWFPRFAKFQPQIDQFRMQVNQHAPKMLFIAKLSLGVMSIPTLVAAGMARVPLWRVAPVQILGEILWTGGLVLIGVYLGQYVTQFERGLQIASIAVGAILLLVVLWLLRKWLSSNESAK